MENKSNRNLVLNSENNVLWNTKYPIKGPGLPRFRIANYITEYLIDKTKQGETKIPDDLVFFVDDIDMQHVNIKQKLKENYAMLHVDWGKMTEGWNQEYTSKEWERIFGYPSTLFM